ncbi:MAG: ABC transporter ATP-binding protein [Chloroflexi bacterium]|nr:ABC transporter ATP-binding protein [Chloroflexota bacterium]MCL5075413.1 ABC transporter ATP-binding protein [Chloroflexota bacterium]
MNAVEGGKATQGNPVSTQGASVRLDHLTKRFGEVVAVDDLCLEIKKGEFITLLGPSGSGKTTTLLMIAGFELPTSGEIFIDDEPVGFKPPYKRDVGMVFQNYALFPHMTVYDNIAFPLQMRKMAPKEIAERIRTVLELVKLSGMGKRYPRQLSGGQQQRVALGRALVFNPPVLLMDEPLGALDRKLREHMQIEIKHIQRQVNTTVIYVTHDQEEALVMSDRIAVMNDGRVQQVGTPDELYERPLNRFVADFIGETNLLQGEVIGISSNACTVLTEGGLTIQTVRSDEVSPGQRVSVALRPEKILFVGKDIAGPNRWEGIIEEVIYIGEITKYRIGTVGGEILTVRLQNRLETPRLRKGDRVILGWGLEDAKIVRGD